MSPTLDLSESNKAKGHLKDWCAWQDLNLPSIRPTSLKLRSPTQDERGRIRKRRANKVNRTRLKSRGFALK